MAEDQGKEEEKFDFTGEGEAVGYISLPQAVLAARRLARENDEHYKDRLGWTEVVWTELHSESVSEDYYKVVLQFRRPGREILEEHTGEEEFLFDLTGILQDRQILVWPEGLQMPEEDQSHRTSDDLLELELAKAKVNEAEGHVPREDNQRAIELLNEAIQLDPDNALAYFNRGNIYANLGQYQRAIEDLDRAIQLEPDNALYYLDRGLAYADLGQDQQAIQDYNEAIRLEPTALHYNIRAFVYSRLGEHQRAIEDFDKAIQLVPDNGVYYNDRGNAYEALGQASSWMTRRKWFTKAREDFNKARSLDSNIREDLDEVRSLYKSMYC